MHHLSLDCAIIFLEIMDKLDKRNDDVDYYGVLNVSREVIYFS